MRLLAHSERSARFPDRAPWLALRAALVDYYERRMRQATRWKRRPVALNVHAWRLR